MNPPRPASSREPDAEYFDRLLPRKNFFHAREVAQLLGLGESTIEKFSDIGQLDYHQYNGGTGQRMSRRFTRESILVLLLKSKAYRREDYVAGLLGLLRRLSASELATVQAQIPKMIAEAKAAGERSEALA